jgi:hypothetical protein
MSNIKINHQITSKKYFTKDEILKEIFSMKVVFGDSENY